MAAARAALLLPLLAVAASGPGVARAGPPDGPACRECHEERFQARVTHFPAAAGLCEACHQVQPRHLEDGDPASVTKERSAARTCFTCHDPLPEAAVRHAALDLDEGCGGCHDPHGGERRHLLRKALPALCADCHDVGPAAAAPAPGGVVPGDGATAAVTDGPPHQALVQGAACLDCHGAHGAPEAGLLRREPAATCLACHARRLPGRGRLLGDIRWKVEASGGPHGLASWASQREGRNVGRECLACHLAHPPAGGGLLKAGVEALCFGCHRQQDFPARAPGRRLHPGTRHPAGGGPDPAQPGRPFTCVSCHEPHGSSQPALFRYRPIKGASEQAQRCGHCHASAMGLARPAAPPPWDEQDARP